MRLRFPHLTYPLRPLGRRGIRLSCVAALALSLIALPAFAEPALWVAKQGGATVYLFGTVHALKPELKWETPKIARAFAESQELWLEADDADAKTMQPIVAQLGIDRAHPLSSKLAAADVARLDAAAKAAGLPGEAALEPMRPWLAALTIATLPIVKAGYDPAKGVDNVLKLNVEDCKNNPTLCPNLKVTDQVDSKALFDNSFAQKVAK